MEASSSRAIPPLDRAPTPSGPLPSFDPIEAPGTDERLFAPEGSAEGCASGECLPAEPAEEDAPPPPAAGGGRDDLSQSITERWRQAVESVRRVAPRQGASLAFARLLWMRPGEVAVAFQPAHGFHKATVVSSAGKSAVEKCFQQHFGRPTALKIENAPAAAAAEVAAIPGPSIAEQEQEVRRRHEQETEATVRTHPAVRAALKWLGGEIEHIQVLEPEPKPAPEATAPEDGA